ncbi:hypothetical protein [Streptomyces agglomeratus]|uniref:hypothetical protein n=1 Tax=Streptomyces agglomeratus TaxID=285458 RepID=UPI001428D7D8|nr:hypothetical protein [Streptomyces agglomeratus]
MNIGAKLLAIAFCFMFALIVALPCAVEAARHGKPKSTGFVAAGLLGVAVLTFLASGG